MTLFLSALAGAVVAVASWSILRQGEIERDRLGRALGVARPVQRSASPPSLAQAVALIGAIVPPAWLVALGGLTSRNDRRQFQRIRALTLLLALGVVLLMLQNAAWAIALLLVPRVARFAVEYEDRAAEAHSRRALDREATVAIDTFVIALDAGLPFDRATAVYAESVDSRLAGELAATVRDLEVGYRRREALERLVARTGSANLTQLANAVRLAEDFGTPLAQALRALAIEIRATRRQRLQERALRAPVTMLLPTAGLILLPIFAIVLGPVALRLASGSLF